MSGVSHNMYYIAGRIDDEERIRAIRDEVYSQTNAAFNNYVKRIPHLTFVNRIKLPVTHESDLHSEVNQYNPSAIPIQITGFCVWPSIDKPRYISLEVDAQIDHYQSELTNAIDEHNGDVLTEPPQPHITLFKCENPHEVSERMKQHLRKLEEKDIRLHTYIPYIDLLDDKLSPEKTRTTQSTQQLIQLND